MASNKRKISSLYNSSNNENSQNKNSKIFPNWPNEMEFSSLNSLLKKKCTKKELLDVSKKTLFPDKHDFFARNTNKNRNSILNKVYKAAFQSSFCERDNDDDNNKKKTNHKNKNINSSTVTFTRKTGNTFDEFYIESDNDDDDKDTTVNNNSNNNKRDDDEDDVTKIADYDDDSHRSQSSSQWSDLTQSTINTAYKLCNNYHGDEDDNYVTSFNQLTNQESSSSINQEKSTNQKSSSSTNQKFSSLINKFATPTKHCNYNCSDLEQIDSGKKRKKFIVGGLAERLKQIVDGQKRDKLFSVHRYKNSIIRDDDVNPGPVAPADPDPTFQVRLTSHGSVKNHLVMFDCVLVIVSPAVVENVSAAIVQYKVLVRREMVLKENLCEMSLLNIYPPWYIFFKFSSLIDDDDDSSNDDDDDVLCPSLLCLCFLCVNFHLVICLVVYCCLGQ
ncbi:hypothetical protein HELRODRAFT_188776 [Helobdella robusta]|uniref:Uncharacterized protein n=1 Tax=Helobdella robusta TaxID=6412 RepID=T1FQC6_HELRO|nr:hypothetical protein HELRODRAFT_188776 [Helobdella robusta]ESO02615.1 hypothetical protein HELRODRAFT_188776 [Helobdella robusta]